MKVFRAVTLVALLASCSAQLAHACSVSSDYRVPNNLELTEKAQAIIIGRVERAHAGTSLLDNGLEIQLVRTLKGEALPPTITLTGLSLAEDRFLVLSNPYELREAHPLAYIGGCARFMFPLGTMALFFLKRDEKGDWGPAAYPFSRWAEDVPGIDAPWVRLTDIYIHAESLTGPERNAFLIAERDRLKAKGDDPVSLLMAADIDRQLKGPNRPWNDIMMDQMKAMGFGDPEKHSKKKHGE